VRRWIGAVGGAVSLTSVSSVLAQPTVADAALSDAQLPSVIVTAQRRAELLSDVPMSITALTAQDLRQRSVLSLADYASSVASVAFTESGGFGNELKIRGIGTGTIQLSPTVAVYLGEVPVVHTGRNANSSYDFRVVDMERIEVLNGPQGQLYGANSLGGAVKYVPTAPRLGRWEGGGLLGGARLKQGSTDRDVQARLNIPLGQTAAARLVVYDARVGGYYDNVYAGGPPIGSLQLRLPPGPGQNPPPLPIPGLTPEQRAYRAPPNQHDNVNAVDIQGLRAQVRVQPSDRLRVDLMLFSERKKWAGASYAELVPGVSDLSRYQHNDTGASPGRDRLDLASAVVTYDFDSVTLTSSTSRWKRRTDLSNDFSEIPAFFGYPNVLPMNSAKRDAPTSLTQELRVASADAGKLQWLAGLFWNRTDQDFALRLEDNSGLNIFADARNAVRAMFGAPPSGSSYPGRLDARYKDEQVAGFGELKYQFTDAWNAAISFRSFRLTQDFVSTQSGVLFNVAPGPGQPGAPYSASGSHSESVFTPKYQLTWTPAKDSTYYATVAKGYRTGVVNVPTPPSLCGASLVGLGYPETGVPSSKSDTVWNHELGTSLVLAERSVHVNAAIFLTRWKDIQGSVFLDPSGQFCPYTAIANVGDAKSQGAELKIAARVSKRWKVDFAGSYTDARYTRIDPKWVANAANFGAREGDTIQMTPRLMGNVGVEFNITAGKQPSYIRLDWNYVGDMKGAPADFHAVDPATGQPRYPNGSPVAIGGYSVLNARLGWSFSERFGVDLYARNIANRAGVTFATDLGGASPPTVNMIRPRSVGVDLHYEF